MIAITGTIRNTVKLAELDNKWKQKKSKGAKAIEKEMTSEIRIKKQYEEDLKQMRESNQDAGINAKVSNGALLTLDEISYLKKNNPKMYQYYLEIRQEKECYEQELESCETKDEVERLRVIRLGVFAAESKSIANNPQIPKGAKLALMGKILGKTMAIQEAHIEFTESIQYINMPTEKELEEQREAESDAAEAEISENSKDNVENVEIEIPEEDIGNTETEVPEKITVEYDDKHGEKEETIPNTKEKVAQLRLKADNIFHEIKNTDKNFRKKTVKDDIRI